MNDRHRRVERLRSMYETPAECRSRNIIQAFLKFGQAARKIAISINDFKVR